MLAITQRRSMRASAVSWVNHRRNRGRLAMPLASDSHWGLATFKVAVEYSVDDLGKGARRGDQG